MKDTKSLAWLLPVAGLLILFGWFLGRTGWNLTKLEVGIGELEPPTATSASQTIQPSLASPTIQSVDKGTLECIQPTELINKRGWTDKGGPVDEYGGWNVELSHDDLLPMWWEALGARRIVQSDPDRTMTAGVWTIYTPFKDGCREKLGYRR